MTRIIPLHQATGKSLKAEYNKRKGDIWDFTNSYYRKIGEQLEPREGGSKENLIRFSTKKEWEAEDYCIGCYGYKNDRCEVVIPAQFDIAGAFSCGRALVGMKKENSSFCNWFYIDETGKTVIDENFIEAMDFNQYGVAWGWDGDKCHLIDKYGNRLPGGCVDCVKTPYCYQDRYLIVANLVQDYPEKYHYGLYDTKKRQYALPIQYEWSDVLAVHPELYWFTPWKQPAKPILHANHYDKPLFEAHMITHPEDNGCSIVGNGYAHLLWDEPEYEYLCLGIRYGIQDRDGELLVPMKYHEIFYLYDNVYLGMIGENGDYDKIVVTPKTPVLKTCKITAMKQVEHTDLMEQYENPIDHSCDVKVGDVFFSYGGEKPENLCQSAWESMEYFVKELAKGGGNFYDGWMKNPKSAMISCNDGFRPVSFYIEVME